MCYQKIIYVNLPTIFIFVFIYFYFLPFLLFASNIRNFVTQPNFFHIISIFFTGYNSEYVFNKNCQFPWEIVLFMDIKVKSTNIKKFTELETNIKNRRQDTILNAQILKQIVNFQILHPMGLIFVSDISK